MIMYRIGRLISYIIVHTLFKIVVIGKEDFPESGPVIVCTNHTSNFDPQLVGSTIKRPVSFMAKSELFEIPVIGKIMYKVRAFPVRRGMNDRNALKLGLKVLKDGLVMGLFPEGSRSKTGEIGKPLAGAGFFALRSDAVIIPCAIVGEYKLFKKVYIIYGEPLDMTPYKENKASPQEAADAIMDAIQEIKDNMIIE